MSYPVTLDEYTEAELQAELDRRERDRNNGRCDYCHRSFGETPLCKFPDRHRGKIK